VSALDREAVVRLDSFTLWLGDHQSPIYRRRRRVLCLAAAAAMLALVSAAWVAGSGVVLSAAESDGAETPSACANGTAVASPAAKPGLVADCEALLAVKDELRGTASLNWSASLALSSWTGITVGGAPQRVTAIILNQSQLDGVIPAGLSRLSQLNELRLAGNRLTGSIPAELAQLRKLTIFFAGDNQLSGALPAALGSLPRLRHLNLRDNRFSGAIPPAWADLWSLESLALQRNRLSGAVPAWLDDFNLLGLRLSGNSGLSGCIPVELRSVEFNDLATLGMTWCAALPLRTLTLTAGAKGAVEPSPGAHSYRDGARVRLLARPYRGHRVASWGSACAGKPEVCIVTMDADKNVAVLFEVITYSLTASADAGGTVTPSGRTSYTEPTAVTLTAAWNDATHTFAGWSGACTGTATTCELEVDDDLTVTAAFTLLPADRCSTPTASDCIRAVFVGAPDDYAQVQDIPADRLLSPDADGRYSIGRGQQVTVVTTARLPANHSRFMPNVRPKTAVHPTARLQLIRPVGTTFSLTASSDAYAPDRFELDLHAARTRPGNSRPIPGPLAVTTRFNVRPDPLALELTSSRDLCTAGTLTELSWTITGGKPPYALAIDGQTVNVAADSHRANCGPIPTDPVTGEPADDPTMVFTATVTDSQATPATATSSLNVELAPPLPAMTATGEQLVSDFEIVAEWYSDPAPSYRGSFDAVLARWRQLGAESWSYGVFNPKRWGPHAYAAGQMIQGLQHGTEYEVAVAAMRDELESHTPQALDWTSAARLTTSTYLANVVVTTTHDTLTVEWDRQPSVERWSASLSLLSGDGYTHVPVADVPAGADDSSAAARHRASFRHLPPDTEFELRAGRTNVAVEGFRNLSLRRTVRTKPAPETGYTALPRGPQNLRATATATTITVTWDPPHPGANNHYRIYLKHPDRATSVKTAVYKAPWTVTFGSSQANRTFVEPETTFTVRVLHVDIVNGAAETTVTTRPLIPPRGVRPGARSEGPICGAPVPGLPPGAPGIIWDCRIRPQFSWPYELGTDLRITSDVWVWRWEGYFVPVYHAGVDYGGRSVGEPLRSLADGYLREYQLAPDEHVVYCPALSGTFHEAVVISSSTDSNDDGDVCTDLATAFHGRVALTFHEFGGEYYAVQYAHLSTFADGMTEANNNAVSVRAGQLVGHEGGSGLGCVERDDDDNCVLRGFNDSAYASHLHMVIRRFDGTVAELEELPRPEDGGWRGKGNVRNCSFGRYDNGSQVGDYCGWTDDRELPTVVDPEEVLAPPPPAVDPAYAAGSSRSLPLGAQTGALADRDPKLRFPITSIEHAAQRNAIDLGIEAAVWRPTFYANPYLSDRDHGPRQSITADGRSRLRVAGLSGTRAGVLGYSARSRCGLSASSSMDSAPVYATGGELWSEVAPLNMSLRLLSGQTCHVTLHSHNGAFAPTALVSAGAYGYTRTGSAASLPEPPTARFQLLHELRSTQRTVGAELEGNAAHIYPFQAYGGLTYEFCTTKKRTTASTKRTAQESCLSSGRVRSSSS